MEKNCCKISLAEVNEFVVSSVSIGSVIDFDIVASYGRNCVQAGARGRNRSAKKAIEKALE
jgi:hypothetical protein